MSTDKHSTDKELPDLSEKPMTDAEAEKVKGGVVPPGIPHPLPPTVPKAPGVPPIINPCW